jgi:hypothetical protein
MQLPIIKCFNPKSTLSEHHFFILSKGLNAGKPLDKPCANCFVAHCIDADVREFFYWLSYGLWKAKRFDVYLIGSVIPFIRLHDLQSCLLKATAHVSLKQDNYVDIIKDLKAHHKSTQQLIKLINEQQALLEQYLRSLIRI